MANDEDIAFFDRELESFVPDRVFDAHAHIYQRDHSGWSFEGMPEDIGLAEYQRLIDDLHPGRLAGALVIPYTQPSIVDGTARANQFVSQQISGHASYFADFFISPADDPEWVRQEVRRLGLHGFKCYHTFSDSKPTWEADIPDYLPESIVRVAHEEGWVITLHMVKSRCVADPGNLHWIRHYCQSYPNMKLILAHSARGFQPAHNLEGLPQLKGIDNLYFDTSANCEPIAHQAIIRHLGHEKLLYGSDFPISHLRGRSLAASDSFLWLYEDNDVWDANQGKIPAVLVGLEHLRSLKWACWSEHLSDSAVEDIFYGNAARLFGL